MTADDGRPKVKGGGCRWRMAGDEAIFFSDWRENCKRFPAISGAMEKFRRGKKLSWAQIYIVRGVLAKWMEWHRVKGPRMISGRWTRETALGKLDGMIRALRANGIEPIFGSEV